MTQTYPSPFHRNAHQTNVSSECLSLIHTAALDNHIERPALNSIFFVKQQVNELIDKIFQAQNSQVASSKDQDQVLLDLEFQIREGIEDIVVLGANIKIQQKPTQQMIENQIEVLELALKNVREALQERQVQRHIRNAGLIRDLRGWRVIMQNNWSFFTNIYFVDGANCNCTAKQAECIENISYLRILKSKELNRKFKKRAHRILEIVSEPISRYLELFEQAKLEQNNCDNATQRLRRHLSDIDPMVGFTEIEERVRKAEENFEEIKRMIRGIEGFRTLEAFIYDVLGHTEPIWVYEQRNMSCETFQKTMEEVKEWIREE